MVTLMLCRTSLPHHPLLQACDMVGMGQSQASTSSGRHPLEPAHGTGTDAAARQLQQLEAPARPNVTHEEAAPQPDMHGGAGAHSTEVEQALEALMEARREQNAHSGGIRRLMAKMAEGGFDYHAWERSATCAGLALWWKAAHGFE